MRSTSLLTDVRGATAIEYAAIASLVSIAAIGAMAALGTSIASLWGTIPGF